MPKKSIRRSFFFNKLVRHALRIGETRARKLHFTFAYIYICLFVILFVNEDDDEKKTAKKIYKKIMWTSAKEAQKSSSFWWWYCCCYFVKKRKKILFDVDSTRLLDYNMHIYLQHNIIILCICRLSLFQFPHHIHL